MYVLSFGYTSKRRRTQPVNAWKMALLTLLLLIALQGAKGCDNEPGIYNATVVGK